MSVLNLRVRYYQDSTPDGVPCREENFIRREILMPLPTVQTALVLVDVWNTHYIESWLERAREVTVEEIVPALAAARAAGLTIVHAPSPEVASHYPQSERRTLLGPAAEPDWPPAAFRCREGEYAQFRGPREQPPGVSPRWNRVAPKLGVSSSSSSPICTDIPSFCASDIAHSQPVSSMFMLLAPS